MKRLIPIFFLAGFIYCFSPLTTEASLVNKARTDRISNDLTNYWTFDGADFGSSVIDVVGGKTLVVTNYAATSNAKTIGRIGQGANCLGGTTRLDGSAQSNTSPPATGFSVTMWLKFSVNNGASIFDWGNRFLRFDGVTAHKINFSVDGGSSGSATSGTSLDDGRWHFVAFTSTANAQNLYVDNVLDGTASETLDTTATFFTLCNSSGGSNGNVGAIDDVRVYNRIITAAERTALYEMVTPSAVNKSPASRLPSGLLGLWSFDGPDLLTNVTDRSGQANNGAMLNFTSTSTAVVSGRIGQGLLFDGVNDRITMGSPASLTTKAPLSISAWIKPRSFGVGNLGIIIAKTNGGSAGWDFGLAGTSGHTALRFDMGFSGTGLLVNSADNVVALNTWQHVVVTWDGSVNTSGVHIYKDGVETSYGTVQNASGSQNDDSSWSVTIGALTVGGQEFDGIIDSVRVYNRVLSASEVKALYTMGTPSVANKSTNTRITSGLVGAWSFDGPDILQNVADRSGNGNNGFMSGFTSTSSAQIFGKMGQGLKFDGVNDYVAISGDSATLQPTSLTVSAWINYTGSIPTDTAKVIVALHQNDLIFRVRDSAEARLEAVVYNGSINPVDGGTGTALTRNTWTHVLMTYNGSVVKFWKDGVFITSTAAPAITWEAAAGVPSIGSLQSGGGQFFPGKIDDVRVYNTVLATSSIQALYNLGR